MRKFMSTALILAIFVLTGPRLHLEGKLCQCILTQ